MLKELGGPGQVKLSKARVVLIGLGGLGAPAALYLTAAGIGHLRLVDPDHVCLDNLQRQILYRTQDIGRDKVKIAKEALCALDPNVIIEPIKKRANDETLSTLLDGVDIVLDGCDNFETRFSVNKAAIAAQIPLVSGAVGRWDGQLSVFAPHLGTPCYRCFVPEVPSEAETCEETGIIGALTGIIGSAMALETIKIISGAGSALLGKIMIYDGLSNKTRTVQLDHNPSCSHCSLALQKHNSL